MLYTVHLISKARDSRITGWTASRREIIVQELNRMYAEILQSPSLPDGCQVERVRASFGGGTIQLHEVACVIHASRSNSIIAQRAGQGSVESRGACYRTTDGMVAEIFLDRTQNFTAADQAALIMHELVHYKLDADPDDQAVADAHAISGTGLHQAQQYQNNALAPAVRDLMAARLMAPIRPYIGSDWNLRRAT